MTKPIITATAALCAALGLGRAEAASMQTACLTAPCVYDHDGKIVGVVSSNDSVWRQISGAWYQLDILQSGLAPNPNLYFLSTDCSGQPYIPTGYIEDTEPNRTLEVLAVPYAEYDGHTIWGPVGQSEVIPVCYSQIIEGQCLSLGGKPAIMIAPALKLETPSFTPPFTVR
jgi:hypothetical protein